MDSVPTSVDSYFLELYKKKVLFPSPEINIFFAKFPSHFGYFYPKDFFYFLTTYKRSEKSCITQ